MFPRLRAFVRSLSLRFRSRRVVVRKISEVFTENFELQQMVGRTMSAWRDYKEKTDAELAKSKDVVDSLNRKILDLETQLGTVQGQLEITSRHRDLLADVVAREQQRVQAETGMYLRLAENGEPVRHVGASVSTKVNPFGEE